MWIIFSSSFSFLLNFQFSWSSCPSWQTSHSKSVFVIFVELEPRGDWFPWHQCNCRSFLKAKPMCFHKALVINLYCDFNINWKDILRGSFQDLRRVLVVFCEGLTPRLVTAVKNLDKNLFWKEHLFTPCYLVYVNFAVETILSPKLSKQDWLIERVNINIRWNKFALKVDFQSKVKS